MRKNLKKLILLSAAVAVALTGITGCSGVDLSSDEEALIVEYAVNSVINHDKNYIVKLAERETEAQEPTTWLSENTDNQEDGENNEETNTSGGEDKSSVSVNEAFGIDGFTVEGNGYELADKYPNDENGFSMVAISEYDLLILKFNVTNNSQSQSALNLADAGYRYRCIVNGKVRLNAQVTALLNGMNTWNGTFEPGETKEMVLIFQLSEEVSSSIENVSISVIKDGDVKSAVIK